MRACEGGQQLQQLRRRPHLGSLAGAGVFYAEYDLLGLAVVQGPLAERGPRADLHAVEETRLRRPGKRPFAGDLDVEIAAGVDRLERRHAEARSITTQGPKCPWTCTTVFSQAGSSATGR